MADERKQMKTFGAGLLVIGAVAASLAWFWRENANAAVILISVFWSIGLLHLLLPKVARPIFAVWMRFAGAMAWFNTRLLLILFFHLIVWPVGLIMKIIRRDALDRRMDPGATTYWVEKDEHPNGRSHYEHQY